MSGRRQPPHYGTSLLMLAGELELPSIASVVSSVRGSLAVWSRSLADRLVGPVERWCPICELELQLHAADRSCIAPQRDDDS